MPSQGEAGGRTVAQDPRTEDYDLKYVRRIRARAVDNDRRTPERKARVLSLCTQLINELESDPEFGLNRTRELRRLTREARTNGANGHGKRA